MKKTLGFRKLEECLVSRRDKLKVWAQRIKGFSCRVEETPEARYGFHWKLMRTDGVKDVREGDCTSLAKATDHLNGHVKDSIKTRKLRVQ